MEDKGGDFVRNEILRNERAVFLSSILITSIGYFLLSYFLNLIRASAPIFIVWAMIFIQFVLYSGIFLISYYRFRIVAFKTFAFPIFVALAVLGRINDWEIIIIPALVLVMIVLSMRTKKMKVL